MRSLSRIFLLGLVLSILGGCASTQVLSDQDGIIVIRGPRLAFGPGHETYTREAQAAADKQCESQGRDKAAYLGGRVALFDADYNRFSCMVSSEKVLALPDVKNTLADIGKCVRSQITELDDLSSDAATVASGIAIVCSAKIDSFLTLFLTHKKATKGFSNEFSKAFKADQHRKILPFVLKWRNLVRSGRKRNDRPTESELPDSLIQI